MAQSRKLAYAAIDSERDYQDTKYPTVGGYSATPEGFLLIAEELLTQARADITKGHLPPLGDGSVALEYMRKLGATAVRAMEQHGAPVRKV